MTCLVKHVARVHSADLLRESLIGLALLAAIRTLQTPNEHALVGVECVLSVEVLDERVQPRGVNHAAVVMLENSGHFGSGTGATLDALSLPDTPDDAATQHAGKADLARSTNTILVSCLLITHWPNL